MKKTHLIILSILTLNIIALLWWFSDTQVIKRQTKTLAESLSMAKSDSQSIRALKHQKLILLLSDKLECIIDVSNYSHTFDRSELTEVHLAVLNYCESTSAEVSDISISFNSDTSATVTSHLNLAATEKGGKTHSESCTTELTWQQNDESQWRLSRLSLKGKK